MMIAIGLAIALGAIALAASLLAREEVTLSTRPDVCLTVPSDWGRLFGSRAVLHLPGNRRAVMGCSLFEAPVILLPHPSANGLMCVYDFDLTMEVIVFNDDSSQTANAPAANRIRRIVLSSDVPFRPANAQEVGSAIDKLTAMDEITFQQMAVPSLDLGVVRRYADKDNVIARLRNTEDEQRRVAAEPSLK